MTSPRITFPHPDTRRVAIFIHGLADGRPSEHDERWLAAYDHTVPRGGGIVSTARASDAMTFDSIEAAAETWRLAHGLRLDGLPNRPLTAFSVSITHIPAGVQW